MSQKNNPLHGIKLEQILTDLQSHFGWQKLAMKTNYNGFKRKPTIKSALKRLRQEKDLRAREAIEELWLKTFVDREITPPSAKRQQSTPAKAASPKASPWDNSKTQR